MSVLQLTDEEAREYDWLGLGDPNKLNLPDPLDFPLNVDRRFEFFKLLLDPDYFHFSCKYIFGINLLPFQQAILKVLWTHKFPMLIGSRGLGKSLLLGLYALMRMTFNPGCKVVICGAGFRQSKMIFNYMLKIWENAPMLRDIAGNRGGPSKDPDQWIFRLGDSETYAIPIGTGDRVRGLRAHYILSDEFGCLGANTLVETNYGLMRIKDAIEDGKEITLINQNGKFEEPALFNRTPLTDVYEVETKRGFSFKCSVTHQVQLSDGTWKLAKDLDENDHLRFDNQYEFPAECQVDRKTAWVLGYLVAEGCVTKRHSFAVSQTSAPLQRKYARLLKLLDISSGWFHRDALIDPRGWKCKESFVVTACNIKFRTYLASLGLGYEKALKKKIPHAILAGTKEVVRQFLRGLFIGDGSAFLFKTRHGKKQFCIAYYSGSKQLIGEVQVLLAKLNILTNMQSRPSRLSSNEQFTLRMNGHEAVKLAKFLNIRKWNKILAGADYDPEKQRCGLSWDKARSQWGVAFRVGPKMIRKRFASRDRAQEYFSKNSQVTLQVRSVTLLPHKERLYDFYLPKTNSFYGNGFVQHNTIPIDIYEQVIQGFAAVSADPEVNVREIAQMKFLRESGMIPADFAPDFREMGNQSIITGTGYYAFNWFCKYWNNYKTFIHSRGDPNLIREVYTDGVVPRHFDHRDFAIVRMPYELIPEGFMDDAQVARARATNHSIIYAMEYGAVFPKDSIGFFRRTLIESCVTNSEITLPSGPVSFAAMLKGDPRRQYVIGVDPASEKDNLAITVIELHGDHRRVVYCWTINRQRHKRILKDRPGLDDDYYAFCARKIRDLMDTFPCVAIAMDHEGGGIGIEEALQASKNLKHGESAIFPRINEKEPQETDDKAGLHLLDIIMFSKADWVAMANHGLKMDMENKRLLFPRFDAILLGLSAVQDSDENREFDTLEDNIHEIEAMKDELSTIEHTQTSTGRDRWDTPEHKISGSKKGRMKKDRYSALLMANAVAREIFFTEQTTVYTPTGGFINQFAGQSLAGKFGKGPAWYEEHMKGAADWYGVGVRRPGV